MIPEKARSRRRWVWRLLIVVAVVLGAGVIILYILRPPRHEVYFRRGLINQRAGRSAQAVENFRSTLELKPDRMDARRGLIQALKDRKAFSEALAELDNGVQRGMNAQEATVTRAGIFSARAAARAQEAGKLADPPLYDRILAEDVRPAIALVQALSTAPDATLPIYMTLGDLYSQEASFLFSKRQMLTAARDDARKLQKMEEAAAKDAEALTLVPEINASEAHAVEAYIRAMEKDPKAPAPRLAIARYALASYAPNVDRVRALLEPILKDNPNHRPTLLLLVRAEHAAGKLDKALEILRGMRAREPDDPELMLLELSLLVDAEKWTEAGPLSERVEKRLLPRQNRRTAASQASLADYCRGLVLLHESRPTDAAVYLQDIFAAEPDVRWPKARLELARALESAGNCEQAISDYRAVLTDVEGMTLSTAQVATEAREAEYQACLALIRNLKSEDLETVSECAATALRIFPLRAEPLDLARDAYHAANYTKRDLADLVLVRVAALALTGKPDAALAECRKELETGADSTAAKARLRDAMARIWVAQGAFQEAAAAYEELWHEFPVRMGYGHELAALKARLGQTAEARKIYESLLDSDPSDLRALRGLLALLVRTGDLPAARALVARAEIRLGPDTTAALLSWLAVMDGRLDDAISIAKERAQQRPDYAPGQVALAELLWKRGDLAGARAAFDAGIKADPQCFPAYRRGLLDLQEGRAADAVSLFHDADARFPKELSAKVLLILAMQADGKTDGAIAMLDKLLVNVKKPMAGADAPRWALAVMEAGQGNLETAISQNNLIFRDDLGPRGDRQGLLGRLAALSGSGRAEAARSLNLLPTFITGAWQTPALQQLEILEKLLPGEMLPECWYASMLGRTGKQAEAMQRYQRVLAEHPDSVLVREMIADSQERSGNLDAAVQVLEEALQHAPAEHSSWLQLRLGSLYEKLGDLDRAIASYRNAMNAGALAPFACNNLAYLLATKKNDIVSALPLAEQAARLAGNSPEIEDTLGWIYFLKGDTQKAVASLERAKAGLPAMPTVRYHLGMAYLKSNRQADAKEEFQDALALSRDFPEAADAAARLSGI